MKKIKAIFILFIIIAQFFYLLDVVGKEDEIYSDFFSVDSVRNNFEEIVIIPDNDPLFGTIGSYVSCWYNSQKDNGLKPLIIHNNGHFTDIQRIFFSKYFEEKNSSMLILGENVETDYEIYEILGTPSEVSINTATYIYSYTSAVLIISNDVKDYQLSLVASPLASYLDIPILIFNNNSVEIINVCNELNVTDAIIIGDISLDLPSINITKLNTAQEIQNMVLSIIREKFGEINYITLTNPADVIQPSILDTDKIIFSDHISNFKLTILGKEIDVFGNDTRKISFTIPDGINSVQIFGNISTLFKNKKSLIVPIIFLTLFDLKGNIVGYSSSLANDYKTSYIESLICNASGNYTLDVRIYNGILGGYFSRRGISFVDLDYNIDIIISKLETPHLPNIPNLSIMSPYLTAAHGGILLANSSFELTDENFLNAAQGYGSGPWYFEELHTYTNEKVHFIVDQLNETLDMIDSFDMLDDYLSGPAWLGILAGFNMIPQYYYSPSQIGLAEKGLPSDNPYSLNQSLSVGRIMSWNIQDVSSLICRTFFYKEICGNTTSENDWHNRFNFIFGEGFGETGGIFHQIPYSQEIREYGFNSKVYGNLRNGRLYAELFDVYTGSNYIEYLGHGDWFWCAPSLYGLDIYSKAIDVAHVKDWIYEKPSVFLTSACLMGRFDGVPPQNSIGLTMIHSGCNAFIGATRETGQEAGLTTLENHLIVDDFSLGEALRGEKKIDKETPTYYVRTLFGDPAFNPFEPNNGFSSQGRPILLS